MKKIIYLIGVLLLAAVSCQKIGEVLPGDGNVTFTLQTPGLATKAIADGTNVDIVYYEIYKAESKHKNSINGGEPLIDGIIENYDGNATLSLNLLQGQEYVALFWAQVDGYTFYDIEDLREVTVDYTGALANDENRAAFCKAHAFDTHQARSEKVELVRPFAQINLGTTKESLDIDYHIDLEESYMAVQGVGNTFNVFTYKTADASENVEFALAAVPDQMLEANGSVYAYAGMNYILVPADESTVNISYTIKTDVGSVSRQVPAVPVKKNHRTNLLGNLLTQETSIEIVVDERFADHEDKYEGGKYGEIDGQIYVKVESAEELVAAAADENVDMVILVDDVTLESQLQIYKNMVLDLNGKTITATKSDAAVDGIWVRDNAEVVITGNGTVNATLTALFATATSKLTIENGTFIGGAEAVFAQKDAKVVINGGTFKSTQWPGFTLNLRDRSGNGANDTATITVYGGTFHNFNPADNAAEGAGTNFVAEGYKAEMIDANNYIVVKEDVAVANDAAEFSEAISNGKNNIILGAGNYTLPSVSGKAITISGSKETMITIKTPNYGGSDLTLTGVTVMASGYATGVQHVNTVTYNDVKVIGEMCLYGEAAVFNNCIFELNNQYIWTYGVKNAEFNGCTFNTNGKAILVYNEGAGATNVAVDACTFNATAGAKAGAIANQNCAAIEIDNYQNSGVGAAHNVTASNNTYNDYFSGEWRIKNFVAGNPIKVNGVEYTSIAVDGKLMTIDADKNVTVL